MPDRVSSGMAGVLGLVFEEGALRVCHQLLVRNTRNDGKKGGRGWVRKKMG